MAFFYWFKFCYGCKQAYPKELLRCPKCSERCRVCDKPISSAELCAECADGNDPFFACDNSGSDLRK